MKKLLLFILVLFSTTFSSFAATTKVESHHRLMKNHKACSSGLIIDAGSGQIAGAWFVCGGKLHMIFR